MHAVEVERLKALLARHGEASVGEGVRRRHISEPAQKKTCGAVKHVVFQDDNGVGDGRRGRRIERAALDANEWSRAGQLLCPKNAIWPLKAGIEDRGVRA